MPVIEKIGFAQRRWDSPQICASRIVSRRMPPIETTSAGTCWHLLPELQSGDIRAAPRVTVPTVVALVALHPVGVGGCPWLRHGILTCRPSLDSQ